MNESIFKTKVCKRFRDAGGYARRIEDQFAVGTLDMMIVPHLGRLTYFIEAKIIKGRTVTMTPRQVIEAERINQASNSGAIAMVLAYREDTKQIFLGLPRWKQPTDEMRELTWDNIVAALD